MKEIVHKIVKEFTPLKPIPTGMKTQGWIPSGIRVVLFDVYGTLLVSGVGEIGIVSYLKAGIADVDTILEECGFSCSKKVGGKIGKFMDTVVSEHHLKLHKKGIEYPEVDIREVWSDILLLLWKELYLSIPPDDNQSVLNTIALCYEAAANPLWPMPGFPHIVRYLTNAGIKAGIVSNAQFYTPLFLEAFAGCPLGDLGIRDKYCAWSWIERQAKPSPHIFSGPLDVIVREGIKPEQVLYVGNDMLNDIQAASVNGCQTCLFAGDKRSLRLRKNDARVKAKPSIIITELGMLENLVN